MTVRRKEDKTLRNHNLKRKKKKRILLDQSIDNLSYISILEFFEYTQNTNIFILEYPANSGVFSFNFSLSNCW